jgi:hypothetical protein
MPECGEWNGENFATGGRFLDMISKVAFSSPPFGVGVHGKKKLALRGKLT